MKNEIDSFKQSMAVIETVCIYNTGQKTYIYQEGAESQFDFLLPMIENNCIETVEFLYFNNNTGNFFICRNDQFISIFKLRKEVVFNKVLLEHKSSIFLSTITELPT
ncbi:MAG: hypothetical protein WBA74_13105 [Cyclobacteriaceae bacterium]